MGSVQWQVKYYVYLTRTYVKCSRSYKRVSPTGEIAYEHLTSPLSLSDTPVELLGQSDCKPLTTND